MQHRTKVQLLISSQIRPVQFVMKKGLNCSTCKLDGLLIEKNTHYKNSMAFLDQPKYAGSFTVSVKRTFTKLDCFKKMKKVQKHASFLSLPEGCWKKRSRACREGVFRSSWDHQPFVKAKVPKSQTVLEIRRLPFDQQNYVAFRNFCCKEWNLYLVMPLLGNFSVMKSQAMLFKVFRVNSLELSTVTRSLERPSWNWKEICKERKQ